MPIDNDPIVNPLPGRFLTGEPGVGGVIKARPEDFIVEELPLYEPCGHGEHLYLRIEKTAVSHAELTSCIRRHFGVRYGAIGFAGMKDKAAVTRQTISVHLPGRPALPGPLQHERIQVRWVAWHTNKLRLGHLAGNRFAIRIRDVDPMQITRVRRILAQIEDAGMPNYFGSQRFGYRRNNHRLGLALLRRRWHDLLEELLGTTGSPYPAYQQERRVLFDEGRYAEAAASWTPSDRNELAAINARRDGRTEEQAVRAPGRSALRFWISSLQSAVFNRVLDHRIEAGRLVTLGAGDLAWKHDSGAVFAVRDDDLGPELQRRLAAFEVSPSGPLWGAGMTRAAGEVDACEQQALQAIGLTPEQLDGPAGRLTGARRPMRVPIRNVELEGGADEHGPYIRVAFDLPGGAYATVLLGEVMKNPPPADDAVAVERGAREPG